MRPSSLPLVGAALCRDPNVAPPTNRGIKPLLQLFKPEQAPGHLIKPAMYANRITFWRSLLAGDSERPPNEHVLYRLRAGSYIPTKPKQTWGYGTYCG